MAVAKRALDKGLPVLIQGETGAGKEVVAKALHEGSRYQAGSFIAINCAAIPDTLIEGELFGHTEGAYTGAKRGGAPGKLEQAHRGTLFLDEIGDMPLALQSRLLRVLETREVTRLGGQKSKQLDFQLVCATHRDLSDAVHDGDFRKDLLYRIKGMAVQLPSLRERSGLREFVERLCQELTDGRRLSDEAFDILLGYGWPGNVRELSHTLTYADVVADADDLLMPHHLPMEIIQRAGAERNGNGNGRPGSLKRLESEAIDHPLARENGDVGAAARRLGIGRATLYRRLREKNESLNGR